MPFDTFFTIGYAETTWSKIRSVNDQSFTVFFLNFNYLAVYEDKNLHKMMDNNI